MQAKLKALWAKLNTDVTELWGNSKGFLFLFGIIILGIKFRNILINLIVSNGKSIFNNATQQSAADQKKEDESNQAANQLVDAANKLPNNQTPVTDDWYEDKGNGNDH